jgi:hypothetical protein
LARRRFSAVVHVSAELFKLGAVAGFAHAVMRPWLRAVDDARLAREAAVIAKRELERERVAGADFSEALLAAIAAFAGGLRPSGPPVLDPESVALTAAFIGAIDALYFALVARRCSKMPWGLAQVAIATAEKRAKCVQSYVGQALGRDPRDPGEGFADFGVAGADSLNRFLVCADGVWEARMAMSDKDGVGDALLFFVEIEPWIRAVVTDEDAGIAPQEIIRRLCWDTGQRFEQPPGGLLPRSGAYLRWFLLKVVILVQALRGLTVEPAATPEFQALGEPAPAAVFEAIDRLQDWFALKAHKVTIPLRQM